MSWSALSMASTTFVSPPGMTVNTLPLNPIVPLFIAEVMSDGLEPDGLTACPMA